MGFAFKKGLPALSKKEFVCGWCSVSFHYHGLRPDGVVGVPEQFLALKALEEFGLGNE